MQRTFWRERKWHHDDRRRWLRSEIICTCKMNSNWSCSCCFSSSKKRIKWSTLNERKNNLNKSRTSFDPTSFNKCWIVQSKSRWSCCKDTQRKKHQRINDVWEMIFTRNSRNHGDVYSIRQNMQFMFTNEPNHTLRQLISCKDGRIVIQFRLECCEDPLQENEQKQIHSWIVRLNKVKNKLMKYLQVKSTKCF